MGSLAGPISSVVGSLLGGVLGGITGQNSQQWQQGALVNVLNFLQQSYGNAWPAALQSLNPSSAASQGLLDRAPQLLFGNPDGSTTGTMNDWQTSIQNAMSGINPSQFQQTAGGPQAQGYLSQLSGPAAGFEQLISNGGWSPQGQQIYNAYNNLSEGANPNQTALESAGYNLLANPASALTSELQQAGVNSVGQGGMTPQLSQAMNSLMYMVNQGGSNPNINSGVNQALNFMGGNSNIINELEQAGLGGLASNLGVSGLTPTGAQGEQVALQGLQAGGANQNTNFLQQQGQQMAGTDSVIPMLLATSLARDQGAQQMQNAAEGARTQAMARGGGPGAAVANGASNAALADFASQGAQGIANNVQNAIAQQEGLGLQQQSLGSQMAQGGGNLQQSFLNTFGGLLNNLEGDATQRYSAGGNQLGNAQQLSTALSGLGLGSLDQLSSLQSNNILQALGMVPGTNNAAANNAQTFGGLGLQGGNLQLQNLLGGGTLSNDYLQSLLSGTGGMQNELTQANNYTLGAGQNLNSMTNTQLQNLLGFGNLGMNQMNNYYGALGGLMNQQGNFTNAGLNMYGTGTGSLNNIGNTFMGNANTSIGGMPGIFNSYQPNNPWAQLAGSL